MQKHIHEDIHMVLRVLHRDGWWALTKTAQRPLFAVLPFTRLIRHMPQCHQLADAVVVRFKLLKPAGAEKLRPTSARWQRLEHPVVQMVGVLAKLLLEDAMRRLKNV
jgi:hypothetical protein